MTERDNSERIGLVPDESITAVGSQNVPIPTNTGLNFVSPTEHVKLPSKGRFYPEGHPLFQKEDLEIKYMTAKEEDILTSKSLLKKGIAVDRMLESVIIDKSIKLDDLILGDKNALILVSRITGYGSKYETTITCPQCSEKTKNSFNLDQIVEKEAIIPENIRETGRGTFMILLPKTNADVEVRPLFGKDEKHLLALQEMRAKNHQPENLATTQMKLFVVSVAGQSDRKVVDSFIESLPAMDSKFLRTSYKELMPDVDMKQLFECSKCSFEEQVEVPLTVGFFWPGS